MVSRLEYHTARNPYQGSYAGSPQHSVRNHLLENYPSAPLWTRTSPIYATKSHIQLNHWLWGCLATWWSVLRGAHLSYFHLYMTICAICRVYKGQLLPGCPYIHNSYSMKQSNTTFSSLKLITVLFFWKGLSRICTPWMAREMHNYKWANLLWGKWSYDYRWRIHDQMDVRPDTLTLTADPTVAIALEFDALDVRTA